MSGLGPGPDHDAPRSATIRDRLTALMSVGVAAAILMSAAGCAESRLQRVRHRGHLVCGVAPGVAGFAAVDAQGRYAGFDVDFCRAMAAAIFATPDKVRYVEAASVDQFVRSPDVDVVSRRLTWTLQREGLGLLFGPVTFYDGQGFLVPLARRTTTIAQLANSRICVVPGNINQFNLNEYFEARGLTFQKVNLRSLEEVEPALLTGACEAWTADLSELGAVLSTMKNGDGFVILEELISKEPLAQVVRQGDDQFFSILRWTVYATIAAEELGITSANVTEKLHSGDLDTKRLLGVLPGNGRALGLDEPWAYNVIKTVGNYGEIFERNIGMQSPIRFRRGFNALWTDGGLMYAPLMRQ
jgi:general L-amino acid transport system substrate-binding protein